MVILRHWTKATGDGKDVFPVRKGQSLAFLWHKAILTGAPSRSQCVEGMSCPAAPFSLLPWLLKHTGSPRETLEALPHAKVAPGISLAQESLFPPQEHLNPVLRFLVPEPPVSARNMVLTYPQFANEETGAPRAKHLAQNHSAS